MDTPDSNWPGPGNMTGYDDTGVNGSHVLSTFELISSIVIITVNILAIIVNVFVIIITVTMTTLRRCNSSYLEVSMCVVDILASAASLPKFIRYQTSVNWVENNPGSCQVYEFLNGFFLYSVISYILALNVNKYHAIKFPMHYTNRVTKTSIAACLGTIFVTSVLFSAVPLLVKGKSYLISCRNVYGTGLVTLTFAGVIVTVYFIVPTLIITFMSASVYRVAKRSLAQIGAMPTFTYNSFCMENGAPSKKAQLNSPSPIRQMRAISVVTFKDTTNRNSVEQFSQDIFTDGKHRKISSSRTHASSCVVTAVDMSGDLTLDSDPFAGWSTDQVASTRSIPCNTHSRTQSLVTDNKRTASNGGGETPSTKVPSTEDVRNMVSTTNRKETGSTTERSSAHKLNCKAIRNLVLPYVYFIFIWGFYFVVYMMRARGRHVENEVVTVTGVLVYASFALNPIVYVLPRKNFKEETLDFFRMCRPGSTSSSVVELRANQTFQQFIESR